MIVARAPYRISLVGGGTDFPKFFERHGGAVVSFAIDKHIYSCVSPRFEEDWRVSYTQLEIAQHIEGIQHDIVRETLCELGVDDPLEIVTIGDLPGKSGLGSSSAMAVSFLKALRPNLSAGQLSELACTIEIERGGAPIGVQDQYAVAFGGMNTLEFSDAGVVVQPITSNVDREVTSRLLAVHSGEMSDSNKVLEPVRNNIRRRTRQLCQMRELARQLSQDLRNGRWDVVGEALSINWELKKQLADGITTQGIDELYDFAIDNGAEAGKILGSGGGGFLLLWSSSMIATAELNRKLEEEGLSVMRFNTDPDGATVVFDSGEELL